MIEIVGAAALGCACWSTLKWLGGVVARATVRSVAADAKWRRHVGAPIFDLAGNILEDEATEFCTECGKAATELTMFGRCQSCYSKSWAALAARTAQHRVAQPVEVAANRLSPLGFVVMSLRLSDEVAQRLSAEHYKQVVAVVEVAADRLSGELRRCEGCGGFGGVHTATCSSWGDMLAMDQDEMLTGHKPDKEREDAE